MKNFDKIYETIYKENILSLEIKRKKSRNRAIILSITLIPLVLLICILIVELTNNIIAPMFIIIIFVLAIIGELDTYSNNRRYKNSFFIRILNDFVKKCKTKFVKSNDQYTNDFKEKVIKQFIKEYDPNLNYDPKLGISESVYINSEFERYNIFKSEDLIFGTVENGCGISMSEIHTSQPKDEGETFSINSFHGLFATIELNKNANCTISIRKNQILINNDKNKIEMDSSEFEKIYNVYTTDKITAMQLLTSDIMQMFIDFKHQNSITPEITIKENYLYIRFATGNMFEAKILKNSLDYKVLKKYYNTINFTLDLTKRILKNINDTEI